MSPWWLLQSFTRGTVRFIDFKLCIGRGVKMAGREGCDHRRVCRARIDIKQVGGRWNRGSEKGGSGNRGTRMHPFIFDAPTFSVAPYKLKNATAQKPGMQHFERVAVSRRQCVIWRDLRPTDPHKTDPKLVQTGVIVRLHRTKSLSWSCGRYAWPMTHQFNHHKVYMQPVASPAMGHWGTCPPSTSNSFIFSSFRGKSES